jgi:hypothetical protein
MGKNRLKTYLVPFFGFYYFFIPFLWVNCQSPEDTAFNRLNERDLVVTLCRLEVDGKTCLEENQSAPLQLKENQVLPVCNADKSECKEVTLVPDLNKKVCITNAGCQLITVQPICDVEDQEFFNAEACCVCEGVLLSDACEAVCIDEAKSQFGDQS